MTDSKLDKISSDFQYSVGRTKFATSSVHKDSVAYHHKDEQVWKI